MCSMEVHEDMYTTVESVEICLVSPPMDGTGKRLWEKVKFQLVKDDEDDTVAKMKAVEEALDAKQKHGGGYGNGWWRKGGSEVGVVALGGGLKEGLKKLKK
ncbi:hypothetical protein GOBAR_DD26455 [Gossypium barbadense]|nr:hypothetical protein GOBAR_DD26455 [Gossypium barbadense]